ncbi:MAG TPA: DegT/DnrJ/EryC1/StrS aminotransferase family protein [Bacteroidota bacterium]|nr:DegT/DnrJ/EryC1/StrS aminotransferase family protein [Bacteroidota bacterium]
MTTGRKKIDFIDLKAQQRRIRMSLEERIKKVMDHGAYIMGPEIAELEGKLAQYVGVKHCVGCASGTDALLLPLMAYGIGPGDVVFTSPFTFIATAEVVALLGASLVFVDINPRTYNIDPEKLDDALSKFVKSNSGKKAKGVIPVDLFGQTADYDAIGAIAKRHGLFVLQDAAQSFGATYKGRKAGSFGDVAATSFFPAKPLGCYGDGGAMFCNDDVMAEKLRSLRVHGQGTDKYDNVRIGINGRLDSIQAAVLLSKMEIFDEELALRDSVARRYTENLHDVVTTPFVREDCTSAWAQYSILATDRNAMMSRLKTAGVPTAIYYPKPLHLQEAFRSLGYKRGDFPVSERIADSIFSIPMHPYLDHEDQDYIVNAIRG